MSDLVRALELEIADAEITRGAAEAMPGAHEAAAYWRGRIHGLETALRIVRKQPQNTA